MFIFGKRNVPFIWFDYIFCSVLFKKLYIFFYNLERSCLYIFKSVNHISLSFICSVSIWACYYLQLVLKEQSSNNKKTFVMFYVNINSYLILMFQSLRFISIKWFSNPYVEIHGFIGYSNAFDRYRLNSFYKWYKE